MSSPSIYLVREFKSDLPYLRFASYEEAFDKCIELHIKSHGRRTFYVAGPTIPKAKKR